MIRRFLAFLLVFVCTSAFANADASHIQLELRKLTVLGSTMYVAAHPDDDNAGLIGYLATYRDYRTAYLSMTRGDGGQNLIGDEKGALLGVLRTQELLDSRSIDGGEQFFTRAIDFGFSKGPQESLAIWGHDTILADVVWNIRRFQPDVIITRFPTTGEGGHGHHTASAILAGEAFAQAGDATKFPDQLRYVTTWQPRRLFFNQLSFRPLPENETAHSLRVDIGTYNPLLGESYGEIAAESRSENRSQGTGGARHKGTIPNYFVRLAGDPATTDMFEGIDTTWSRYAGGDAEGKILQQASDTFDPNDPSKSIPLLLDALAGLDHLGAMPQWNPRVNPWIAVKRRELLQAILDCAGMSIDVSASDSSVVPGGEIPISVTVVNRSGYPFQLQMIASPYADPGEGVFKPLANNEPIRTDLKFKVPADMPLSQPYWLREPPAKGAYTVDDQQLIGLAENPPSIPITVTIGDNKFHTAIFTVPAIYRWVDPVYGEETRSVDVVPEVTANPQSGVVVFPDTQPKTVTVALQNFLTVPTNTTVRLDAPAGWKIEPASIPVNFEKKGDQERVTFRITPPAAEGTSEVRAEVGLPGGKKVSRSITTIDYPHIHPQRVFGDASAKAVRVNVKKRGSRIGYIMGSGDEVPDALRQIGYDVTLLSDAELERGDFSKYDAIVTGVRAYNTRKELKGAQPKLLDYVKNGGTLVLQYNTAGRLITDELGPYPFKLSNDRVTVEEAPVKFVKPDSAVLNEPNKITDADFAGWVQERGLNFTRDWDAHYETPLESHDPGESEKPGGELYTRYGKGVYIYTSYDWFRELPAGVPGAYKLFANLVSAR